MKHIPAVISEPVKADIAIFSRYRLRCRRRNSGALPVISSACRRISSLSGASQLLFNITIIFSKQLLRGLISIMLLVTPFIMWCDFLLCMVF